MHYRGLLASMLMLCSAAAYAQSTPSFNGLQARVPGSTDQRNLNLHFDQSATPTSRFLRNFGQSAARVATNSHNMGGKTLVQFGPPSLECNVTQTQSQSKCP